ncbi:MAG: adenosine kinase [Candidatus Micrarchaeota archaeon]|nr:adenosine kinase [Candidatus Micrarchaeota archaeon]
MDVLTVGTPVIDFYARVQAGEIEKLGLSKGATNYLPKRRLEEIIKAIEGKIVLKYPGDNARNLCEWFAVAGGKCGYCGAIGDDPEGEEFKRNLAKNNIEALLERKKGTTGKIVALITPDKERTFCANLGVGTKYSSFEENAIRRARFFFFTSITVTQENATARTALKMCRYARKAGKKIVFALENWKAIEKKRPFFLDLSKSADIVFMNEAEGNALLGNWKNAAKLNPSAYVFVKRGAKGSVVFWKHSKIMIGALKAEVVDTTGAGDAYEAGVLYGLANDYSLEASAKLGAAFATKAIEKIGTAAEISLEGCLPAK